MEQQILLRLAHRGSQFLSLFLVPLLFFSCKEDDPVEPEEEEIEYYVKYEVTTTSRDSFPEIQVHYKHEMGTRTSVVPRNWEAVFGPFQRLEKFSLEIKRAWDYEENPYDSVSFTGRISIARPGHPFVLKDFWTSHDQPLKLEYQVCEWDLKGYPF